ncbi:hypothetical protein EIN43_21850 [Enterobacter hormaechei]|uniref:Peptidase M48 domain-containing protein n=1 Tax=Enterobacter hormaechei TaxID=158836 RepID=A0A4Y5ZRT1_9ENTR|nr:hypothetical protein EIN43_21850 [Enterobacter hormaechei]
MKALSDEACKDMDGKATLAPANSTYTQRLNKIASALGDNINGQPVNYKVYMAKDVNAFAMANGCIRVYSGLMDMMTDNEVEAVIGHEMGHVALGHVKKGMQVALGTNAVRAAAASAGGIVGSLSQSQLGDVGEKLVNSQFSQRQESEADDYSYDLLRKRGINPSGLATSFENWRNWRKAVKAPCLTITRPPLNARSISVTAWRQTVLNNTPARCAPRYRATRLNQYSVFCGGPANLRAPICPIRTSTTDGPGIANASIITASKSSACSTLRACRPIACASR